MSSLIVRDTFRAAFQSAFPNAQVKDVENFNVEPAVDANGAPKAFFALTYVASEEALGVGNTHWRERGTINVLIYSIAGRGSPVSAGDSIRNTFAGKTLRVPHPGVRLALTTAEPLTGFISSLNPIGVYSVGMVAIAYEFDFSR